MYVSGHVLPAGKTIKACFGTTKYCNAFLKGVPCNNHDCLYLHDIGESPVALVGWFRVAGALVGWLRVVGAPPGSKQNVLPWDMSCSRLCCRNCLLLGQRQ
jgi:hypothetical protein